LMLIELVIIPNLAAAIAINKVVQIKS
jgi:hypothetical protein